MSDVLRWLQRKLKIWHELGDAYPCEGLPCGKFGDLCGPCELRVALANQRTEQELGPSPKGYPKSW